MLERALCRPLNFSKLSRIQQWEIDAELGILDWDPTPEEAREYIQRRREQRKEKETCHNSQ